LDDVVERRPFRFLEATVTPSNASSWGLFRGYAGKKHARLTEQPLFHRSFFPGPSHEEEVLIRIGPLQSSKGDDT
jgi:L-2,4-diaminobutyric acid acetyltransferase